MEIFSFSCKLKWGYPLWMMNYLHCCDIINKQWEPTGFQLALIDDDSSDSTITVVPIGWKGIS